MARDLFVAERPAPSGPFGAPLSVLGTNIGNQDDSDPFVTADGCELYFASDRGGSMDLYVAKRLE
jgi:hypothetical protein